MSVEQYKTGTVTVTNGSNVVTGNGTAWAANIIPGNAFMIQVANAPIYTVLAVDSNTQLRLSVNYAGTSGGGKAYAIQRSYDPIYGMPRPVQGDFDLPAMVTRIVDITAGVLASGGAGGFVLTFANMVALELAAAPRMIKEVFGNSSDGGTTPDTSTQASINALLSAGVPAANIIWNYVIPGAAIQLPSVSRVPIIAVPTLIGISLGVFTLPNASMVPIIVVPTLAGAIPGVGLFTIPAQSRAATITVPTLVVASIGSFTMPTQSRAATITVPTIIGVGAPTQPVISVTPGDTQNVVSLTSGGSGATSFDIHWGTVSGTRSNTISGVTLPYTHTGRTNGTPYYYSLVATNAAGSTESAEESGNPSSSISRTTDGKLFFDDFESGNLWTFDSGTFDGTYNKIFTSGGSKVMQMSLNSGAVAGQAYRGLSYSTPFAVSVKMSLFGAGAGLETRFLIYNSGTSSGYLISVAKTKVEIVEYPGGASIGSWNWTYDQNYHLYDLVVSATTLTLYQDGISRINITESSVSSFNRVYMYGSSAVYPEGGRLDNFIVAGSPNITCSNLPSGYKLKVNGNASMVATASSGTATVPCMGFQQPYDKVEVLNDSDVVQATYTNTGAIFSGSVFALA